MKFLSIPRFPLFNCFVAFNNKYDKASIVGEIGKINKGKSRQIQNTNEATVHLDEKSQGTRTGWNDRKIENI